MHAKYWSQNLSVDGKATSEWILKKYDEVWTGCIWLRIGTRGGVL
jgi:hypothetical protein